MKNTDWIFSEILQENFKIFYKDNFLKKVVFSKGAIYKPSEIDVIKNIDTRELKQVHIIKTALKGRIF